jgi:hypothetical protein
MGYNLYSDYICQKNLAWSAHNFAEGWKGGFLKLKNLIQKTEN